MKLPSKKFYNVFVYSSFCYVLIFFYNIALAQPVYIGEGSSSNNDKSIAVIEAKNRALSDLVQQLRVEIKSDFTEKVTESSNSIQEYTSHKIQTASRMSILGLRWETGSDKTMVTAKAILDKDTALDQYTVSIKRKVNQLNINYDIFLNHFNKKLWNNIYPYIRRISGNFEHIEQEYTAYFLLGGKEGVLPMPKVSRGVYENYLNQINQQATFSVGGAMENICFLLSTQIASTIKIEIMPPSLENTGFYSPFSKYIHNLMQTYIPRFIKNSEEFIGNIDKSNMFQLSGTYWISENYVELFYSISDASGTFIGGANTKISRDLLSGSQTKLYPDNFNSAFKEKEQFNSSNLVYGDLKIEFWTNKGNNNLIFQENEKVTLFVQSNQPCYIRCIYHLANGQRIPLYKNYYLSEELINQPISLPELICAPPFGIEKFQLFASTVKFPLLNTQIKIIDGIEYETLLEELQPFLNETRGMIRKKTSDVFTAERILVVSTIP